MDESKNESVISNLVFMITCFIEGKGTRGGYKVGRGRIE